MSNIIKMFLVVILFMSCSTNSNNNLKGTNWNLTIKGKAFDLINDSENQTTISFSEDKFILKENGESFQEGTYKILNKSRISIKNIDGEYNGSINYNSEDNSFDLIFEGFSWRLDGISIKN